MGAYLIYSFQNHMVVTSLSTKPVWYHRKVCITARWEFRTIEVAVRRLTDISNKAYEKRRAMCTFWAHFAAYCIGFWYIRRFFLLFSFSFHILLFHDLAFNAVSRSKFHARKVDGCIGENGVILASISREKKSLKR